MRKQVWSVCFATIVIPHVSPLQNVNSYGFVFAICVWWVLHVWMYTSDEIDCALCRGSISVSYV